MMKRIIALLLALILTVGLLPTVALAADAQPDVQVSKSDDNLNLVKTIKKAGENYTVTLESWATGAVTTETTPMPLDIILVLDESGSMSETFSSKQGTYYEEIKYYRTNQNYYKWSKENDGIWYKDTDNNYYRVTVQRERVEDSLSWHYKFTYTYSKNGTAMTIGSSERKNTNPRYTFYRQYTGTVSTTKRDALVDAATKFADSVYTEATKENGPDHRIAIVTYSTNASIKTGTSASTALVNVKSGLSTIKNAINNLQTSGSTYIDKGIQTANSIFNVNAIEDGKRARVMIVFTDGAPGYGGKWCEDGTRGSTTADTHRTANAAIAAANVSEQTYGATVYTIGIFQGANVGNPKSLPAYTANVEVNGSWDYKNDNEKAKATANSNRFMHLVSSNYPSATSMTSTGNYNAKLEEDDNNTYYLAAASAGELSDVFTAISSSIKTDTTELNETATIIDNIPGNFTIPTEAHEIKVYTAKCTGKTRETLSWKERQASNLKPTTTTNTTTGVKSVSVTGFDYSDEWCGLDENNQPHGSKLIIEFTISHNNYGGTQPTNAGASIKDKEGNEVIKVDDPAIPVKITEPSITGVTRSKVYDGTGFDVLSTIAEDINALADGKKNAYVDIVVTVTSGSNTYTYTISKGATTGSWDKTGLTTEKDVKIENGAVSSYTYDLSITFKDATANGAADAIEKTTATYTITKRPVTLTSASDEKVWDGTALTNDTVTVSAGEGNTVGGFVTGEGATYDVTGSQTNVGSSDNTFTYTLNEGTKDTNYEITQKTGTLTVKPIDQEVVITIKGQIVTATYDGGEKTASGYTVTVPEGVDAKNITVAVAEGKTVPSVSAMDATTTALVQTITADMFTVTSPYKKVTINCENGSLTINPRKVKMVSGSASKAWDGNALTDGTVTDSGFEGYDGFVNGEGATYSVTGTITDPGEVDNEFTYTLNSNTKASNYDITQECGKLTITGSKTYTVIFKTTTPGGKIDSGIADVTHTDLTEGVSFPNRPITTPDTGYYFDGWYKDNTKVTSFPEKVTENATYTAKWLSYNSINLDLTGKIQKTLNSDVALSNERFTINLTLEGAEAASATATATVSAIASGTGYTGTAPFQTASDEFKLTFTAPDTYKYYIAEEDGLRAGMTYDVNKPANGHQLVVVVQENASNHALFFESVTIDGTEVNPSDENDTTPWLTITNNYVEPKETFDLNTLITKKFEAAADSKTIPTGTYEFKAQIVETDSGWNKIDSGATYEGTATLTAGGTADFAFGNDRYLKLAAGDHYYLVSEISDTVSGTTGTISYDNLTYSLKITVGPNGKVTDVEVKNFAVVSSFAAENAVEFKEEDHITFNNTYFEEKDPNECTIDFSKFVKKELTTTGSKTVDEATFIVDAAGSYDGEAIANALTPVETQATTDEDVLNTTLTATIKNIVGGNVYEEPFTGSVTVSKPGHYTFTLTERKGTQSGVTYDESTYQVFVNIKRIGDNLVIRDAKTYLNNEPVELIKLENDAPVTAGYIIFKNTIDTGRDDYIPIIIPTIINKDTGMLNKTDHFAYVIGYPDGTVHPNGQITRAEVATIFFRLLRDEVRDGTFTTSNTYSDVAYGKWYNNPISTMSALGIITGYPDGTFKPNKPITRAEFAAIAARFDETQSGKSATFSDVIGHWAAKEIGIAYYNDWIKGYPDGTFKPDQNITRAEAMTLINRVLERKPESPADLLTNMNKWTDNLDTSKWYYLDVQEATNSHGYTRKTFNYELWRQMLPDPDWSRYER